MNIEIAPKSTEIKATWDDARLYCFALNIYGKTGWRLPTKEEITRIYKSENDFVKDWYWSSTVYNDDRAWSQHFNGGHAPISKFDDGVVYVRAVCDI
jgi:hypothetical protein